MNPEQFDKIDRLFREALKLDPKDRAAFLDESCGGDAELRTEVETLLAHDERPEEYLKTRSLDDRLKVIKVDGGGPGPSDVRVETTSAQIPRRIGMYTIRGLLGEGGMGVVYEAQQEHPRREVALKVVRSGRIVDQERVKLFQREAQTLGRLKHPYIAAIYESGCTDNGQHFFAMELVRGVPLTQYVRRENIDIPGRLELFRKICDAINYAHQRGVIHRDIKPTNIMIDEAGNPKVLDFGLARITDADVAATSMVTEIGKIQGTLAYMSPEQARGNPDEIDVRSDVYSLGVLLYELLTDELPYDLRKALLHEAVRVVCDDPPKRPSTISRSLRGDIETITLKALEKKASRRYQNCLAFSEDVRRYLSDEPILARPPSAVYQLRKLVARHRTGALGIALALILLAVFGPVMLLLYTRASQLADELSVERDVAVNATRVADSARAEAARSAQAFEEVLSFIQGEDELRRIAAERRQEGDQEGAAQALQRADDIQRTREAIEDDPTGLFVSLYERDPSRTSGSPSEFVRVVGLTATIARTYEEARVHAKLGRTAYCYLIAFSPDGTQQLCYPADTAAAPASTDRLTYPLNPKEYYNFGDEAGLQAFALVGSHSPLPAYDNWLEKVGPIPWEESESEDVWRFDGREVALVARGGEVERTEDLSPQVFTDLCVSLKDRPGVDFVRAVAFPVLPPESLGRLAEHQGARGRELMWQERFDEAEPLLQDALKHRQEELDTARRGVVVAFRDLALMSSYRGDGATVEALVKDVRQTRHALLNDGERETWSILNILAGALDEEGKLGEAAEVWEGLLEASGPHLPDDSWAAFVFRQNLTSTYWKAGRLSEMERVARRLLRAYPNEPIAGRNTNSFALVNFGTALDHRGYLAESEYVYRQAVGARRSAFGADDLGVETSLASIVANGGNAAAAERLISLVLDIAKRSKGEEHPVTLTAMNDLATLMFAQGKTAQAEQLYREALAIRRRVASPLVGDEAVVADDETGEEGDEKDDAAPPTRDGAATPDAPTLILMENLAALLHARGELGEARLLHDEILGVRQQKLGRDHPLTLTTMDAQAWLLHDQGDSAQAGQRCRDVLAARREVLGVDHPDTNASVHSLALMLFAQGKLAEAEEVWSHAPTAFTAIPFTPAPDSPFPVSPGTRGSPFLTVAACKVELGKKVAAWGYLESHLAREFLDPITRKNLRPIRADERIREDNLLGRLRALDKQIADRLVVRNVHPDASSVDARADVDAAVNEHNSLRAELNEHVEYLANKYGPPAGQIYELSRVQAQLGADEALLTWLNVSVQLGDTAGTGEHWGCVVRHEGDPAWVRLPGGGEGGEWTDADRELPGRVLDLLAARDQPNPDLDDDIAALFRQRLAPLDPHLQGVRRLIVVPTGRMVNVPLELLTDDYTVTYVPSGTVFAWLRERRKDGKPATSRNGGGAIRQVGSRLLALGDPVAAPEEPWPPLPVVPAHGVYLSRLNNGSNAEKNGLKDGDVVVGYNDEEVEDADALNLAVATAAKMESGGDDATLMVEVWRMGRKLKLAVEPGALGAEFAAIDAATLRARYRMDHVLSTLHDEGLEALAGTRREVEAVAALFSQRGGGRRRSSLPTLLFGSQADERMLLELVRSGELREYRFLHFATHAIMRDTVAMNSALILSHDPDAPNPVERILAHQEVLDGRLTADQIARTWTLDADVVTLSRCSSVPTPASDGSGTRPAPSRSRFGRSMAPGQAGRSVPHGRGRLALTRSLLFAGARSVVLNLWPVEEEYTARLMEAFYGNLLERGLAVDRALVEAKQTMRSLTEDNGRRPFAHPHYWAAFVVIGDPQ